MSREYEAPRPAGLAQSTPAESFLVLDCGIHFTRALLIQRVEGEYRFVAQGEAPGLAGTPQNAVLTPLREATDRLSKVLNRRLLDERGAILQPEQQGNGVDAVLAVSRLNRVVETFRRNVAEELAAWGQVPMIPAAQAFADTISSLAQQNRVNVLGVDVSEPAVVVAGVVEEQLHLAVGDGLTWADSGPYLSDRLPMESVLRWLPFEMDAAQALDLLHSQTARQPGSPEAQRDLLLQQAVLREQVRLVATDLAGRWPARVQRRAGATPPQFALVVAAGWDRFAAPADTAAYGAAALVLLDALELAGVGGLVLDQSNLAVPLAALATIDSEAAGQVLERDGLVHLAPFVAPVGTVRDGEVALTCRVRYDNGQAAEVEVPFGSLRVIPLRSGQEADLELVPARGLDLGLGDRGRAATTRVRGGVLGIVVDARGRPLGKARDPDEQRRRVRSWLDQAGG